MDEDQNNKKKKHVRLDKEKMNECPHSADHFCASQGGTKLWTIQKWGRLALDNDTNLHEVACAGVVDVWVAGCWSCWYVEGRREEATWGDLLCQVVPSLHAAHTTFFSSLHMTNNVFSQALSP